MADGQQAIPGRECDLVLRGGLTSGIVYPGVLVALAASFRLRDIGGASAGAIAAGVAAAAEFGRQSKLNPRAFSDTVAAVADEVGGARADSGGTSFRRLFQPAPGLGRPMQLLWGLLESRGGWALAGVLLGSFSLWGALLSGVASLLLAGLLWGAVAADPVLLRVPVRLLALLLPFLTLVGGLLLFGLGGLRLALGALSGLKGFRENGFGLCSGTNAALWDEIGAARADGRRDASADSAQRRILAQGALADWLHLKIQQAAGLWGQGDERPLLMGDLWCARRMDRDAAPGALAWQARREIDLVLTTSNLSHQVPHRFPFLELPGQRLYFVADELAQVLPRPVVDWMVGASERVQRQHRKAGRHEVAATVVIKRHGRVYHRLPHAANLPVLLGVRLSLSFPLLLSAVRLHAWRCDDATGAEGDCDLAGPILQPCLFSDGGITSNFPITIFDGLFPLRPTFCVNLADTAPGESCGDEPEDRVELDPEAGAAPTGYRRLSPAWRRDLDSAGPLGFLSAVVDTARNAQENLLMTMAINRPRIVTIRLRPDREGGLNLNMSPALIDRLARLGRHAGERLVATWSGDDVWQAHRQARLRSALAAFEYRLAALAREVAAWSAPPGDWRATLEALVHDLPGASAPERQRALKAARSLLELARTIDDSAGHPDASLFDGRRSDDPTALNRRGQAPRPRMGLRLVPVGSQDPRIG